MSERKPIHRALVSVYDKSGLVELATGLAEAGVDLVSTGSTAARIAEAGVPVTTVADVTGFPEILGGRVKTLHPRVHAAILADHRQPEHVAQLKEMGVKPFDLVVANLYPFAETVAGGAGAAESVEQIDIGGPSMVRAAAKNHQSVGVIVDCDDYDAALTAVQAGGFTLEQRISLAAKAFQHTADYDVAVASWLTTDMAQPAPAHGAAGSDFPTWLGRSWRRADLLRYGENPHQPAALYTEQAGAVGLAQAQLLHGKQMSYNNYTDADAAWRAAWDHNAPTVAIVKHANPCGIARGADVAEAYRKANACDPVSAFGGVIAANRQVTVAMAEQVAEIFTEVIVAPDYADGALDVLRRKKNLRILCAEPPRRGGVEVRLISGGMLAQRTDVLDAPGDDPANWRLISGQPADAVTLADLAFAWRACRAVKSNAILLARDGACVGVGMGQVNRVDAVRLALQRAGDRARGSVAASDAYFPFPDGPEQLVAGGVRAIVQPGGSVRDELTVEVCRNAGVTMYFTGSRHFAH